LSVGEAKRGGPPSRSRDEHRSGAPARALAPEPEVVLLDEPWSNIDPLLRASMRAELADILRGIDVTVLFVTHDREEAFSLADRIALMRDGTVVQTGAPEELYLAPADRWTAEFVGAANFLPGTLEDGLVDTLIGRFPVSNANGHTAVDALIRPEQLELAPDASGPGEVVGREFRGHDVFYRVRVGDILLVAQRPSTEVVHLGARVSLRPHARSVTVYA
jgi:iron(III) transport system ATP-binding protein